MDAQEIFTALLTPAGLADPYPLYAELHELGPALSAGPGFVLVPGYAAANAVLRDPAFAVDDAARMKRMNPSRREHRSLDGGDLLTLNDPDHARIRALMAGEFTHRRVARLAPVVTRLTDGLLDAMADAGSGGAPVDFMDEFAFALPVAVICELLGVPASARDILRPLARDLTATLEPLVDEAAVERGGAAAVRIGEILADLAADRRSAPAEDLISALVAVTGPGPGLLSPAELTHNLILLLVAGFETTTNLLGNGLAIVLADPGIGQDLRSGAIDPAAFVEEVLRYDPPVQLTSRHRTSVGEVAGIEVDEPDEVILILGAANRDPARFADPDRFWPGRPDSGSLSFGAGPHFCLGAALARLEGTIAVPRLLRRFPGLAPAGAAERRPGLTFRGLEHLPVRL
jgi:cytochrome P450